MPFMLLATDAHDTSVVRRSCPRARDAAAEICGVDVARALVDGNPRAIISSQPLPYFPNPVTKN